MYRFSSEHTVILIYFTALSFKRSVSCWSRSWGIMEAPAVLRPLFVGRKIEASDVQFIFLSLGKNHCPIYLLVYYNFDFSSFVGRLGPSFFFPNFHTGGYTLHGLIKNNILHLSSRRSRKLWNWSFPTWTNEDPGPRAFLDPPRVEKFT